MCQHVTIGYSLTLTTFQIQSDSSKRLVGGTDIEDALRRLEKLTQEKVRMAAPQGWNATYGVNHKVVTRIEVPGVGDQTIHHAQLIFKQVVPTILYSVISSSVERIEQHITWHITNEFGNLNRSRSWFGIYRTIGHNAYDLGRQILMHYEIYITIPALYYSENHRWRWKILWIMTACTVYPCRLSNSGAFTGNQD
jgi:hypothetical protein